MTFQNTEKLFTLAIAREIEANDFYDKAAKTSANASVRAIFAELAGDELSHMELLERLRADPTLPMKMHKPAVDYKVAEEVELPALSIGSVGSARKPLAMKTEQRAMAFYTDMAAQCADAELKRIFLNLADMEAGHKCRLEAVFVDIGFPETF